MTITLYATAFAFLFVASLLASTFKITKEYERGVVFRLGRPISLKGLRYMQTLLDMGSNQNSTIVFPIPIELIRPLLAAPVPMPTASAHNGTPGPSAKEPGVNAPRSGGAA